MHATSKTTSKTTARKPYRTAEILPLKSSNLPEPTAEQVAAAEEWFAGLERLAAPGEPSLESFELGCW